MKVEVLKRATKQTDKFHSKDQIKIKKQIKQIEAIQSFALLKTEKLIGYTDRYKIRVGNYRIVIKKISNTHLVVTVIANRKDIYDKLFGITF